MLKKVSSCIATPNASNSNNAWNVNNNGNLNNNNVDNANNNGVRQISFKLRFTILRVVKRSKRKQVPFLAFNAENDIVDEIVVSKEN